MSQITFDSFHASTINNSEEETNNNVRTTSKKRRDRRSTLKKSRGEKKLNINGGRRTRKHRISK
jgi:hypothetical protein